MSGELRISVYYFSHFFKPLFHGWSVHGQHCHWFIHFHDSESIFSCRMEDADCQYSCGRTAFGHCLDARSPRFSRDSEFPFCQGCHEQALMISPRLRIWMLHDSPEWGNRNRYALTRLGDASWVDFKDGVFMSLQPSHRSMNVQFKKPQTPGGFEIIGPSCIFMLPVDAPSFFYKGCGGGSVVHTDPESRNTISRYDPRKHISKIRREDDVGTWSCARWSHWLIVGNPDAIARWLKAIQNP